jgi:hypothetical protein
MNTEASKSAAKQEGKTVVAEANGVRLVRWNSYGFRSNNLTASWIVEKDGQQLWQYARKKDALPFFRQAAGVVA